MTGGNTVKALMYLSSLSLHAPPICTLVRFSFPRRSCLVLSLLAASVYALFSAWKYLFLFWGLDQCSLFFIYIYISDQFSSVQSLSRVRLFETPWIAARQASLSITNSRNLLRLMSVESEIPSSHLILSCPLLHLFLRVRVLNAGGRFQGVVVLRLHLSSAGVVVVT